MPPHRPLEIKTFATPIPPDLQERYFRHFDWDTPPKGWEFLNPDALEAFLSRSENANFGSVVTGEFRRMNDLCTRSMNLLVRGYNRAGIELPNDRTAQELAMRLFLDDREAFEYAWSRYLLFGGSPKLSVYPLAISARPIDGSGIARFQEAMKRWFLGLAKGDCNVRHFEDTDELVILVTRGSYMRTVACLNGNEAGFTTFRPASQDVLVYDRQLRQLTVKAGLLKERDRYLRAFAECIAGDETLADAARAAQVFTLAPLMDGTFDYAGNEVITGVDLVKIRVDLDSAENPQIEIRSDDVRRTIDRYRLPAPEGSLTYARFRFRLNPPGERPKTVTFEIEPPSRTDLAQKQYSDLIEDYLAQQGVKLA
jgi:hypothetical protein